MAEKEAGENHKGDDENCYCETASDLQKCLKSVVEKVLKNVSDEKFVQIYKKCYGQFEKMKNVDKPSLSGSSVEAKQYLTQFNSMVLKTVSAAIDQTVLSMNQNLQELEELKKEQSGSSVFWRPPGNAMEHMIPFEYLCEVEKKRELESKIEKEQEALNLLKARLFQKRIKAEEHHKTLLSSISDIQNLVTMKKDIHMLMD